MRGRLFLASFIAAAIMMFASGALARAAAAPAHAAAALGETRGKVFIQRAESALWIIAKTGDELSSGDSVRAASGSSAILNFPGGGYMKLMPLTNITVGETISPEGAPCAVVIMDQGRAWTHVSTGQSDSQFIVFTENAVFNGKNASAFIEAQPAKSISCLEVFEGTLTVRPRSGWEETPVTLNARQSVSIGADHLQVVTKVGSDFDSSSNHSCVPAEAQAAEPAKEAGASGSATQTTQPQNAAAGISNADISFGHVKTGEPAGPSTGGEAAGAGTTRDAEEDDDEYESIEVTSSTVTNIEKAAAVAAGGASEAAQAQDDSFGSDDGGVSFGEESKYDKTEELAESGSPAAAAGGSGAVTAASEEEDEDEFETLEITGSTSLTFTKPVEGAVVCKDKPVIYDVLVSGLAAAAGDAVVVKSTSKCGPVAKPVIVWSADVKCGQIASMSATSGGAVTRLTGGTPKETVPGKYAFEITDSNVKNIVLKALGSNGLEAQYAFTLNVPEPEELALPRITELTINSEAVKNAQVMNIGSDECGPGQFYIEGKAKSDCGEILTAVINAHETPLNVTGTDEFSATLLVKETQTVPISIMIKDSTGARNKPFSLVLDFSKSSAPPTVSIDMVSNNPVTTGMSEPIDVYRNDLTGGKLVVSGSAGSDKCAIKKVETSENNGSSWQKAVGGNSWTYSISPRDGDYEFMAKAYDIDDTESDEMFQPVEVTYYSKTREEILQEAFDTILRAYQDRDSDTINSFTASTFSTGYDSIEDRGRLDNALNGKFVELSTTYLRYRVQTVVVSGKSGRVSFQWDANPATSGYSKTGTFVFQKEGRNGWKLLTIEDDRTFMRYTTIADSIDIKTSDNTLVANNSDTADITVAVLDSAGNAVRNGAVVQFTANSGDIAMSGMTADGKVTLPYTASDAIGAAVITASSGGVSASVSITLTRELAPAPPPSP